MKPFNKHTHNKCNTDHVWTTVHMNVAVRVNTFIHKGKYNGSSAVYRKDVPISLVLEKLKAYKDWDTTKSHPGNFSIDALGNCYDFKDGQLYEPLDEVTTWEVPHAN